MKFYIRLRTVCISPIRSRRICALHRAALPNKPVWERGVINLDNQRSDGWYPDCKVYFDGSNYIALPKTHNLAKRRKPHHKVITVARKEGRYVLAKEPKVKLEELDDDENSPFDEAQVTVEEVIEEQQKAAENVNDRAYGAFKLRTTRKDIFDELYDRYSALKYGERRAKILYEMQDLFNGEETANAFISEQFRRRSRNVIARRQRFARKAYNQKFKYFVTGTLNIVIYKILTNLWGVSAPRKTTKDHKSGGQNEV